LAVYENEFTGMLDTPVAYSELVEARKQLIQIIQSELTDAERKFLLSIKEAKPEWGLLEITGIEKLPAIQWKLKNVETLPPEKHKQLTDRLKGILKL